MAWASAVAEGLHLLIRWDAILLLVAGVVIGFIVGALPGFTSSNAVAVMLPFTLGMRTETALIFMASVYCGAQYGGAVPAILINTPGTPGGAATALDGYPMAQRGEAGQALGIARMASAIGGIISAVIAISIIHPLARVALAFGQPERFVLAVFGLTLIAGVSGRNVIKGMAVGAMGLVVAAMAADPIQAQPRLTFGRLELFDGVPFVPALIGLFALGELIFIANRTSLISGEIKRGTESWREAQEGARLALRYPGAIVRSALIGLLLGVIPGLGTAVANFISYGEARRWSPHPEKFGTGIPEGIIASEAADNGVTAGTMIPTFALGIPGGTTAAIMLAALLLHGVYPGPDVMVRAAPLVYAVLLAMLVASIATLPLGLMLSEMLKLVIRIPVHTLVPTVSILSLVGAFAVRNSVFDVGAAIFFGIVGYVMRTQGWPIVPLVIGLILGPIAENAFARSMLLYRGDWTVFFTRPIPAVMWVVIFLTVVVQPLIQIYKRRRREAAA